MAKQGQNEGVRVLDDFVCEAIVDPSVPKAPPTSQGRNEAVRIIDEVIIELGPDGNNASSPQRPAPEEG